MPIKFLIDTGSSIDIIGKSTFDRIQSKGWKIKLFKTKKKLYPYMSDPIEMLGYFESLIENGNRYMMRKLYVIKNKDAENIHGINSAILLNLVKLRSGDKNRVDKIKEENNNTDKLLEECNDVFNETGKLKNHEAKLYLKENSKPMYQKMRHQPYHLQKLIHKELKRAIENGIIEYAQGPQEWTSNLVATSRSDGRIQLCSDAREVNLCIQIKM